MFIINPGRKMTEALPEQIREWCFHLNESKLHYQQSKVLLSSLKDILDDGGITGTTASKIKKVLHFGDLNEFLETQQPGNDVLPIDRALLGIPINPDHERSVKLSDEEKQEVLDELMENIRQKNRIIYAIFSRDRDSASPEPTEDDLKKLISCLKSGATSDVRDQHQEILENIKKCYEEIGKCQVMLESLVVIKSEASEPLFSSVKKCNELKAQATGAKSKELLGEVKNEILCDEGAEALEIIHRKQKEDVEIKKLELKRLREEVSQYENLKSEGFERVLDEFLLVQTQRKTKEKLKEDYITGFNEMKEG